jgi:hypothetical protein
MERTLFNLFARRGAESRQSHRRIGDPTAPSDRSHPMVSPEGGHSNMLPFKRFLAVTAALVALMAFGPAALAGSSQDFHLDKTCADDASEPLGYICTVQHSDFKWIPAGTDIRYLSEASNVVQAVIEIGNGTTSGACTWSSAVDAICIFGPGTGRLRAFHLDVVVTASADQSVWYWDGTYSFGN